jgi:hypothetical protein
MLPFLTVTAHYIDSEWTLRRQLLSFDSFPTPHTGIRIAEKLSKIIAETGCERRFLGLTGDSASSNLKAARVISSRNQGARWSHLEQFFHCSGHVFNLASHEICKPFVHMQNDQIIDDENVQLRDAVARGRMCGALAKLATMARLHHTSSTFLQNWTRISKELNVRPLKLVTAAATRWNSRYDQIRTAFAMRQVYTRMTEATEYQAYALSARDWKLLRWLLDILAAINFASKYVCQTKQISLSLMIPAFGRICDLLEREPDQDLETEEERQRRMEAAEACRDKLTKYYSHTVENPYYTFAMRKHSKFYRLKNRR